MSCVLALRRRRTDRKPPFPRLPAAVREAEKVEGARFPVASPSSVPVGMPAKFDEARFVGMQRQAEPRDALAQVGEKAFGLLPVLESDDEIIGETTTTMSPPGCVGVSMDRREFLGTMAAMPLLVPSALDQQGDAATGPKLSRPIPNYRIVTKYRAAAQPGMPGPYPGRVVTVHAPGSIDEVTEKVDVPTVKAMIARGMTTLTGDKDPRDSWARFFDAQDFVGIKVNASGAPGAMSMPEVVTEIANNLIAIGVKSTNIVIHERGAGQILLPRYDRFVPDGIRVESASTWLGLDPDVYVEANFFGEEDTRSYLIRMVTEQFTKIVNVPNMKDHGASGVTGCLKNVAYGEFNNVARSHYHAQTETLTFIGALAMVEPLRSRTVLHIMDGLRGVWHAGPFSRDRKYRFYPKQLKFGTDPVAIDRFLIDVIDNKRKQEGAISVWNRDMKRFTTNRRDWERDPNLNRYIREPGHIEYASTLGLGVYDTTKIHHTELTI
jgi:uncharacterized protein (DUF362 family)